MKKFMAAIAAICLSLFVGLTFIACDGSKAEDNRYYAYDADSGKYDENNYLEIRGGECNLVTARGGMTVSLNGTSKLDGKKIEISVSLEYDGEKLDILLKGEKESFGVIRIDVETIVVDGETETLHETTYFCNKGCKPQIKQSDKPVAATEIYYEYDPVAHEYSDVGYISVDGTKCAVSIRIDDLDLDVVTEGTIAFVDNDFVIDCTATVIVAQLRVTLAGVKEKDGVLRVNTSVISMGDMTEPSSLIYYFCFKGVTPDDPVTDQDPGKDKEYTVVFDANGGSFDGQTAVAEKTSGMRASLPEAPPTRVGYVFIQYNSQSDGMGYSVREGDYFFQDSTVYAIWRNAVTVTLMSGVKIVDTITVAADSEIGELPVPESPDGYVFKGWFTSDGDLSYQYNSFSTVKADITLYAEWRTADELTSYAEESASWTEDGHLYIHYLRDDHCCAEEFLVNRFGPLYHSNLPSLIYGDWLIWAWPSSGPYKSVGRYFYPARIDRSGAVYDIDLNYLFSDGGWDAFDSPLCYKDCDIGFQFTMGSSMNEPFWKNDGGNLSISRSVIGEGRQHIFYRQGRTSAPKYIFG